MPALVGSCGGTGTYGSIKFLPSWGSNVSIASCSTSPTTLSAYQRIPAINNSRSFYTSKRGSAFGLRLNQHHARGDVSVESQAHAHGHRHSHDHHCVHDHVHGHTNGHSHEHGHGAVQTHAHSPAHDSPPSHHEDHVHGNGHSCSSHSTSSQCHSHSHDAAAVHAHSHPHLHSHGHSKGVTTHATTHSHTHEHNHDFEHASGCGVCGHDHSHFPETWVSRTLDRLGLVDLAESMTHSTACTLWAMACYAVSLVLCIPAVTGALPVPNVVVTSVHTASIAATFAIIGFPQLVESACLAAAGVIDTHVLMSLAAFGTLYLGMAQEGALLLLLFQLSHILEAKFTAQAQGSLKRLFDTLPDQANAVDLDSSGAPVMSSARSVPARGVPVGTTVLVKPGEEVPLDGVVVWGSANVSQAHISGESEAIKVDPGTQLPAGSRNIDGLLAVKVSSGVDDSTPARIARMAAQAQADKPRLSRLVSTVGEIWSKAVVGVTLVTLVSLVALGIPLLEKGGALYRAMGVLTAGSPCAVVLVPLAYICAIATITRRGVLVRSGAALDALLTCKTVALDKTGTITSGALTLTHAHVTTLTPSHTSTSTPAAPALQSLDLESLPSQTPQQPQLSTEQQQLAYGHHAMAVAVALSRASNHPVSKAMVAAGNAGVREVTVSQFLQVPGMGVQGLCQVSGDDASTTLPDHEQGPVMAYFGSLDYIRGVLPEAHGYHEQMDRIIRQKAETSGARAISSLLITPAPSSPSGSVSALSPPRDLRIALFSFDDQVAPGATQAMQALMGGRWRRKGVEHDKEKDRKQVVMLTGDHDRVAAQVARTVGIDTWHANMKPEHKLGYVKDFDAQQKST